MVHVSRSALGTCKRVHVAKSSSPGGHVAEVVMAEETHCDM